MATSPPLLMGRLRLRQHNLVAPLSSPSPIQLTRLRVPCCLLQKRRRSFRLLCSRASNLQAQILSSPHTFSEHALAKLVAIVGDNAASSLGQASWEDVMRHIARRLTWVNNGYEMLVVNEKLLANERVDDELQGDMQQANIWIVVSVNDPLALEWILKRSGNIPNILSFDMSSVVQTRLKGRVVAPEDPVTKLQAALPGNEMKEMLQVRSLVEEAWMRKNSDSIRFLLLVLIDKYVTPVESLKSLRASDLNSLKCMVKNCGSQILACLANPNCRKALSCLTKCAPTDEICKYQCIVSYESPELEAFSLCILQKHNCLCLTSDIPSQPDVQPMTHFRGEHLTHTVAEDIFVGWLGKFQWSWRVAAGQNPAYDQFPCQFQIFYRGKAKGSMWYDPVFRVKTLDDRLVWRRRHYRVRQGTTPGTFFFSVLDNGVVSNEYWRIVDVTDDLAWALFFYSGAAAAAGQWYTGAVLVTPNGEWPSESEHKRLNMAIESCGIKLWELYTVNNRCCEGPPLGLPEVAAPQVQSLLD